jgi:diaminopimelate decarboxylase
MTFDDAMSVYTSSAFPNIHFIGVDMHLGSQILAIDPYLEACDKVLSFIDTLKSRGIQIHHFDLGGGYGVDYSDDEPMDMELLAKKLSAQMRSRDIELFFEPGRWITANGGILAARVLYNKANGPKNFIVTDAAMTELLRPALYSAYHHIQPVRSFEGREEKTYDVVGPVCESGDRLAKDRSLTNPERGELLAVLSCGSYASVMGSNYNARLKPPEVIVDGAAYVIARRRESIFDTLKNEKF